jgi:pyruvate dehydrogenase E2 component (dihydrolipoamide acetyltransferase)
MQFKLPELGEGVHEGELVKWKVKAGEQVKYDQSLCEIMTDKATVEIPSAFQGKVVHVGQLMLSFEGAAAAAASAGGSQAQAPAPAAHGAPAASKSAASAPVAAKPSGNGQLAGAHAPAGASAHPAALDSNPATRVLAAPSTRRAAREMGVDLTSVQGSGPHGRVMREDLGRSGGGGSAPAAARAPSTAQRPALPQGGEERVAFRGLRKKIAEKMRQSKDHAAHFTYVEE